MENIEQTINSERTMGAVSPTASIGRFRAGDVILGRYTVISELGQGGMGVVYRCLDQVGGVEVAVKGLPPEVSHNSDEMESIRDNYQIVRNLRHSNIVAITNLEKDGNGDYYMVMDVAEGDNLNRWMRKHPNATNDQKIAILRQVASALDYAHSMRIVHRDIKPENVMMDAAGNARVLDFGLAAEVHSSQNRVSSTITSKSGTPHYKAPEQWLGQPQGRASDLYSMAVLAFKLFFNRLPFDADDPMVLARAVLEAPTPVMDDVPDWVNAAFAKALAKKPEDRFATCAQFVDALEGKVVASPMPPSGKSASSGKAKSVALVAVVAFLVGIGVFFMMGRGKNAASGNGAISHSAKVDSDRVEQLAQQISKMQEAKKKDDAERQRHEQEEEAQRQRDRDAAERQRREQAAADKKKLAELERENEELRQKEKEAHEREEADKRRREEERTRQEALKRQREEEEQAKQEALKRQREEEEKARQEALKRQREEEEENARREALKKQRDREAKMKRLETLLKQREEEEQAKQEALKKQQEQEEAAKRAAQRIITCPTCRGYGRMACPYCRGTGQRNQPAGRQIIRGFLGQNNSGVCSFCQGKGLDPRYVCPTCRGNGKCVTGQVPAQNTQPNYNTPQDDPLQTSRRYR